MPHNLPVAVKATQDTFAELFAIKLGPQNLVLCISQQRNKIVAYRHLRLPFSRHDTSKRVLQHGVDTCPLHISIAEIYSVNGRVINDDDCKGLPNIEIITQVLPRDPLITP